LAEPGAQRTRQRGGVEVRGLPAWAGAERIVRAVVYRSTLIDIKCGSSLPVAPRCPLSTRVCLVSVAFADPRQLVYAGLAHVDMTL
jgi:hypothetical protein